MHLGSRVSAAAACVTALTLGACQPLPAQGMLIDQPLGSPLPVYLNGRGPYRFGIDTGQSVAVLVSPSLAQSLSLPIVQRIDASDGTSSKNVNVVRVDEVRLGEQIVRGQLGLVIAPGDSSMDGALGAPFFDGLLVEHDWPANRIRITHGSLPPVDGISVLSARLDHGLPLVPITIAGHAHEAVLDSGSEGGLLLPLGISASLPLDSPPAKCGRMSTLFGEFDLWTARLRGSVRIGPHEIANPVITFSDHFTEINMGRGFLNAFRVTVDPKNSRILFDLSGLEHDRDPQSP